MPNRDLRGPTQVDTIIFSVNTNLYFSFVDFGIEALNRAFHQYCRYVLPFSEVLDWEKAALVVDERQLFQLPYLLRKIPPSKILSLRWHTQFMWDTYFSSVSKIIMTTLEVCTSKSWGSFVLFAMGAVPFAMGAVPFAMGTVIFVVGIVLSCPVL